MVIGAMFKIMHWPNANLLIISASVLKVLALGLGIWKTLSTDKL